MVTDESVESIIHAPSTTKRLK